MILPKIVQNIFINEIDKKFPKYKVGKPRKFETSYIVNRIFKILRTGMQWSELEVNNGSSKTIYNLFNKYVNNGIFKKCYKKILNIYSSRKNYKTKYYMSL